jgi:glycosyltransferase involved in cell wall biosynthesis
MAVAFILLALFFWGVYILQLSSFYKNWKGALALASSKDTRQEFVGISVVIAARNEENSIESCLKSLEQQLLDKRFFETIVVDDHSEDNTVEIVKSFSSNHPDFPITLLTQVGSKGGKKWALQKGIENAKFPLISLTDADCWLPPQWLAKVRDHFVDREINALCGPVLIREKEKNWISLFQKFDFATTQLINSGAAFSGQFHLGNAANLSFKKSFFWESGAFSDSKTPSGDDVFLLEAMEKRDPKSIYYAPERAFGVFTFAESTWPQFEKQRLRWASKNKYFKNTKLQLTQVVVLVVNIFQLLFAFLLFWVLQSSEKFSLLVLLLVKISADYFIVNNAVQYYHKQEVSFFQFFGFSFLYAYYVVKVGVQSFFIQKYTWKGRTLEKGLRK